MAIADISAARDAIQARFKAVWDAANWAGIGIAKPDVHYQGKKKETPKDGTPYVKITIKHVTGAQATLRDKQNGGRFRAFGQVWVDIYGPPDDGLTVNDRCVKVTQSAFEGHATDPDGVLFRNVTPRELGGDGVYERTLVIADFEYDRIV